MKIKGKTWIFGDDIDTDAIIPGKYLRTTDLQVFADHVMEGIDPEFAAKVAKGDIIVAGRNFGCGSSREQAVLAIKYAGIGCVVAASFARIFFRNAINIGLPIIETGEEISCREGDTIEVDIEDGTIRVDDRKYTGTKMPDFLLEILMDGGLVAHRKKQSARDRFGRRSDAYSKSGILSNKDHLNLIIDLASPEESDSVLDIATGNGFLAFEFAEKVSRVIGCDMTEDMLDIAESIRKDRELDNVSFEVMDAESLRFEDGSFDIVSCRFAFHHFTNPKKVISEMVRVCRNGGKIVLVDGLSSEDPVKSEYHNRIEQIRDPSHVRLYSRSELIGMLQDAGLRVTHAREWDADFYFDEWIAIADPGEEIAEQVRSMMINSIEDDKTGLNVRFKDDKMLFTYSTVILVAEKDG